jgi:aspartate-semialdehyde dehydrogenase
MAATDSMRIALIGATGLVGRELLEIAAAQTQLPCSFGLFASAESAGQPIRFGNDELVVQALADCDFGAFEAAFFCIGDDLSAQYVPRALEAGCLVVDKSNAFRMQPGVPLVVAGVNDGAVDAASRLAANPNCSTIILAHALAPWCSFGVAGVWVATYQSVSGAGKSGPERLAQGLAEQPLSGATLPRPAFDAGGFAHNVVPAVGGLDAQGRCSEETKLVHETRKVFSRPQLRVVAHATRVPVLVGHSLAVTVELEQAVTAEQLQQAWSAAPDVRSMASGWPTPLSAMHHHQVEVGRLRAEDETGRMWSFFASGDNLTLGAALNGWRILALLAARPGQALNGTGGS